MALLDRSFRGKCTPEILSFQRVADIQRGEGDLRVELSESELARYIYIYTYLHISTHIYIISTHMCMRRSVFSRLAHLSCLYTVSLTPRTDRSSLEVVVFPPPEDEQVTITLKGVSEILR